MKSQKLPDFKDIAEIAVRTSGEEFGIILDYSLQSLADIDAILDEVRLVDQLTEDDFRSSLFAFGVYVGEVLIRTIGGTWIAKSGSFWIEMNNGALANPLGKVRQRFRHGMQDSVSVAAFGTVFCSVAEGSEQDELGPSVG